MLKGNLPFHQPGPLVLLAGFAGFFAVLFFVFRVLDTEFFRGDPERGGRATPARNEKTALAHAHCVHHVVEHLHLAGVEARVSEDYTAWDVGFDRYLVKAYYETQAEPRRMRSYLCRILQKGAGDQAEDWAIQGVEYAD